MYHAYFMHYPASESSRPRPSDRWSQIQTFVPHASVLWGKDRHEQATHQCSGWCRTKGFLIPGRSNWTICSLLSRFCSKSFPTSLYWGVQFLITLEPKMRKGIHSTVNETQGFLYLGHSNWTICSLLRWFCTKYFPLSYLSYWEVQFHITPERGREEGAGAKDGEQVPNLIDLRRPLEGDFLRYDLGHFAPC